MREFAQNLSTANISHPWKLPLLQSDGYMDPHTRSDLKLNERLMLQCYILCLISRTTVTSLGASKDKRCKTHHLCVKTQDSFLNTYVRKHRSYARDNNADIIVILEMRQSIDHSYLLHRDSWFIPVYWITTQVDWGQKGIHCTANIVVFTGCFFIHDFCSMHKMHMFIVQGESKINDEPTFSPKINHNKI